MVTLAMTLVATVMVMVIGVLIGVWMGRSRRVDAIVRPFLDWPPDHAAFGLSRPCPWRSSRLVGSWRSSRPSLYAAPVAIKIAADGIRGVSPTTVEAAQSAGIESLADDRQGAAANVARARLCWPRTRDCSSYSPWSSSADWSAVAGLGFLVINGFSQREDFGKGLAAGIAITALGIMLDRITVTPPLGTAAPRHCMTSTPQPAARQKE